MDISNLCPGCMSINSTGGKCPVCGYEGECNAPGFLPVKYILSGRYIIGKMLYSTCESAVYLAYDNAEGKAVNIKEFFPEGIAVRGDEGEVLCENDKADVFSSSLDDFWQLNKSLVSLELPALPKTYSVFEENGTAYVACESVIGITLKDFLSKNGGSLKWEQARPLFLPLLDTVIGLNRAGIIHGGISPESIIVGRDGRVSLGEILISRVRRTDKQLTAQIYAGYAAVEQYNPEKYKIGDYTDVYAISATLFRVIMGEVPRQSVDRLKEDTLSVPSSIASELPRQVLVAMANGLQVLPQNRTETTERFRDELVYGETRESAALPPEKEKRDKKAEKKAEKQAEKQTKKNKEHITVKTEEEKEEKKNNVKVWLITLLITVGVCLAIAAVLVFGVFKDAIFGNNSSKTNSDDGMPSVASIGEQDPSAVASAVTYQVPNLLGKTFADVTSDDQYSRFKITFEKKVYSNLFRKGTICEQSVEAGSQAEAGTEIKITISLGARDFQMPTVTGKSVLEAEIQLLRAGLLYENIEVVEKYDSEKDPAKIIEQSPYAGETINEDSKVRIYVNTYEGESDGN